MLKPRIRTAVVGGIGLVVLAVVGLIALRRTPRETPLPPADVDAAWAVAEDLALIQPHPIVNAASFPYVAAAVQALNWRLRDVDWLVRRDGLPFRHVFQGAYGSGFLNQNVVGNDLDYMLVVHLGSVAVSADDPAPAGEEILSRVEAYLSRLQNVLRSQNGPDIALTGCWYLRGEKLYKREVIAGHLNRSLAAVCGGGPQRILVDTLEGYRIPTVLPRDEMYLFLDTFTRLFSDRVQYSETMYPGMRELSLLVEFAVDLEIRAPGGAAGRVLREVPLSPTHMHLGNVMDYRQGMFWTAPAGRASGAYLCDSVRADVDRWAETRIRMATHMASEVERNLQNGRKLKVVKRIHQVEDLLRPALDPGLTAELDARLRGWLQDEDVLLCGQIAELCRIGADVFERPRLYRIFNGSRHLGRTLRQVVADVALLQARHPRLAPRTLAEMDRLLRLVLATTAGDPDRRARTAARAALEQVSSLGEILMYAFLPADEDLRAWTRRLLASLEKAGFRPLPVYGLPDDALGVRAADLAGLSLDTLNQTPDRVGAPAFSYRLLEDDAIPKDKAGAVQQPHQLWIRVGREGEQIAAWEALIAALRADTATFGEAAGLTNVPIRVSRTP